MPETRFTGFPALSVDQRVGNSLQHWRPIIDYSFYHLLKK